MAKGTYQTYTAETPISDYRKDYIRRDAMCGALKKRYPGIEAVGAEANVIVTQIDSRRAELQQAEDDQVRARAIEDAEKLDALEAYTELRRTMFAKKIDFAALLPDPPSTLGRLGVKSFGERVDQAITNLQKLPADQPVKAALLPALETEMAEFHAADKAEDVTRANVKGARVALTLYKTELSQAREAQLGAILKIIGDSEKMAMFTLPWRKSGKAKDDDGEPDPEPGAPE